MQDCPKCGHSPERHDSFYNGKEVHVWCELATCECRWVLPVVYGAKAR